MARPDAGSTRLNFNRRDTTFPGRIHASAPARSDGLGRRSLPRIRRVTFTSKSHRSGLPLVQVMEMFPFIGATWYGLTMPRTQHPSGSIASAAANQLLTEGSCALAGDKGL